MKRHSILTALMIIIPTCASAGSISKEAQAHMACFSYLEIRLGTWELENANPTINAKRLAHENNYIKIGRADLKDSAGDRDGKLRNGVMYFLGKYAEYAEELHRQRVYCDNHDQWDQCPRLVWANLEQIERAAMKFYKRANCELLLK